MNTKTRKNGTYLSWWQRICYGLGNAAGGTMSTLGTTFLMVYYTSVAHIDPGISGTVILISKLLDGISDIIFGRLLDRTNSRFGKARPWLLRMCLPTILCIILAFSVPASLSTTLKIIYVFITYNLLTTVCYTAVEISYQSLNSQITTNQYERGVNGILGMTFCTVILLTFNSVFQKLCAYFGDGDLYSQRGWTTTIILIAVITGICLFVTFLFCPEIKKSEQAGPEKKERVSILRTLKALVGNKFWCLYVISNFATFFYNAVGGGTVVYYAQYVLGDAYSYGSLSSGMYLAMFIGILATFLFVKKIGKRNTMMIGAVIMLVGCITSIALPKTVEITRIALILRGLGMGFLSAVATATLQDILTYGKWRSGFDMVGMGNAGSTFSSKIGSGLGTAVLGWLLDAGGFDATLTVQSATAQNMVAVLATVLPAVCVAVILICLVFNRVDKVYAACAKDLSEGRYGPDATPSED